MRKPSVIYVSVLLLMGLLRFAHAGDVIDRIVAMVNGHIILQSDWDDAVAYEAFIGGKAIQQFTAGDRKMALDRLVDQELLRQQIPVNDPQFELDEAAIKARMEEVRRQFPDAETDRGWRALLARYNLSEDDFKSHVVMQMKILRLVDERLTSTVQVDDKNVEDYYTETFLPQLQEKGVQKPALTEVTPQIRELLTQQKLNDAVKEWLRALRDSSVINMQVEGNLTK